MSFFSAKPASKILSPIPIVLFLGVVLATLPALAQPTTPTPVPPTQATRDILAGAIYWGRLERVQTIVAAHPEFVNATGRVSPLANAVQKGQLEIASFLLEHGANPNLGGWLSQSKVQSPLTQAMSLGGDLWRPFAERLVQAGADVNLIDIYNQTALTTVLSKSDERSSNRQKEQVVWLLAHKAQVDIPAPFDSSALNVAINKTSSEIVNLILPHADVKRRDIWGQTLLFAAVKANKPELILPLLARGADINAQDVAGDTILHLAARGDKNGIPNGELIRMLLEIGANPSLANMHGDLPLHLALRHDLTLDRTFLASTGDFSAPPSPNVRPRSSQLTALLAKTNINTRDGNGLSPLLLAVVARDVESRDLILKRHPNLDATTILFNAIAGGNSLAVAQILKAKSHLALLRLPDGSTPLHIAALWGTLNCAKELLKHGADINARDGQGNTPSHAALKNPTGLFVARSFNVLTFLLASGANSNAANFLGEVPLHLAARAGDPRLINLLLDKGARLNTPTRDGETALLILTNRRTDLNFYKTLLARGADVNARGGYLALDDPARSKDPWYSYWGQNFAFYPNAADRTATLLHRAVLAHRTDLIAALLAKGADIESLDGRGLTPLALAVISTGPSAAQDAKTVDLLAKQGANPNISVDDKYLLWHAVERGNAGMMRALLATHKVWPIPEVSLTALLFIAIKQGRLEVGRLLLDEGANPTGGSFENLTPLQQVETTLKGTSAQVAFKELLLDRIKRWSATKTTAQPIAKEQISQSYTALVQAISEDNLERVKTIIASNPTLATIGGDNSPLIQSIKHNLLDITRFLLDHGANPNSGGWGDVPIISAVEWHFKECRPIADLLLEKGADINSKNKHGETLFERVLPGDKGDQEAQVQWMLSHGADIYQSSFSGLSHDGVTAVDMAITSTGEPARELILSKADVNRRNSQGQTPLFTAVRTGRVEAVRALLNRGADVNAQDTSGDTPLQCAARFGTFRGDIEIMDMLLGAGANPNLPNKWGDLPLHIQLRHEFSVDPAYNIQTGQFASFPSYHDPSYAQRLNLLLAKTDINARDSGGYSPLLESIVLGDATGRSLIHDGDPQMDSITAFFDAVAGDHSLQVAKILHTSPYLTFYRLPDGSTPLHIAAQWGALRCAEELVKRGASVNARNSRGYTPLHNALKNPMSFFAHRAVPMIQFLLAKGASPNVTLPSGDAPLHMAARAGNTELVTLLLQKGAAINTRGAEGATILFILTNPKTNIAFYKKLLAQGADPNACAVLSTQDCYSLYWMNFGNGPLGISSGPFVSLNTNSRGTPLHRAVLAKRKDLVLALLEQGVLIDRMDSAGQTPLRLAVLTYREEAQDPTGQSLAPLLLSKGADPSPPIETGDMLAVVAAFSPPDVLRAFLTTHKVPLDSIYHNTPLLIPPVQAHHPEIVRALLDAGVNPLETDAEGRTPLSFATSDDIKKMLIDRIAQLQPRQISSTGGSPAF